MCTCYVKVLIKKIMKNRKKKKIKKGFDIWSKIKYKSARSPEGVRIYSARIPTPQYVRLCIYITPMLSERH